MVVCEIFPLILSTGLIIWDTKSFRWRKWKRQILGRQRGSSRGSGRDRCLADNVPVGAFIAISGIIAIDPLTANISISAMSAMVTSTFTLISRKCSCSNKTIILRFELPLTVSYMSTFLPCHNIIFLC